MLLGRPWFGVAYSDFGLCQREKSPELQDATDYNPIKREAATSVRV
jgi:hypothetical protein